MGTECAVFVSLDGGQTWCSIEIWKENRTGVVGIFSRRLHGIAACGCNGIFDAGHDGNHRPRTTPVAGPATEVRRRARGSGAALA